MSRGDSAHEEAARPVLFSLDLEPAFLFVRGPERTGTPHHEGGEFLHVPEVPLDVATVLHEEFEGPLERGGSVFHVEVGIGQDDSVVFQGQAPR